MSRVDESTIELPNGVSILCPSDGAMEMPFTVESTDGSRIVCHDVKSLVTAIGMALANNTQGKNHRSGKQGSGPERAWKKAGTYAEKYNAGRPDSEKISVDEARKILSEEKRLQKAEALLTSRKDREVRQAAK